MIYERLAVLFSLIAAVAAMVSVLCFAAYLVGL